MSQYVLGMNLPKCEIWKQIKCLYIALKMTAVTNFEALIQLVMNCVNHLAPSLGSAHRVVILLLSKGTVCI